MVNVVLINFGAVTALPAAMRMYLIAESYDRRGATRKMYCIIAGSAVSLFCHSPRGRSLEAS
jgi:hypothetical protein